MKTKTIEVTIADGVARVALNRPEKKNAMSPQLHLDMTEVLEGLRYDESARVLLITGSGDSFCAGMDLKEFFHELKDKPAEYDRVFRIATEWRSRTLRHYPKPTIAMVNGFCFGGAFSIVESCDLAFAADDAKFGLSEINFKGFPGGSVSKSLANLFHPRDALFYAMTGRPFDGNEAARIGFVNKAFPRAALEAETMQIAKEIAVKDPVALKATKDGYRFSLEMPMDAALNFAAAKEAEMTHKQGDAWRNEGIADFTKGVYRPGLGGHEAVQKKPGA
jgi:trans-feruloyl-CoA hydratase/vanillin synthase